LTRLRDIGNTVIVVEHDEDAIRSADYVVDIGPGAGVHGGRVVFSGTPAKLLADPDSMTGQYLSGKRGIAIPKKRTPGDPKRRVRLLGAGGNNLKRVAREVPGGLLVCVTGVAGAGKSTVISDTLVRRAARELYGRSDAAAPDESIENL